METKDTGSAQMPGVGGLLSSKEDNCGPGDVAEARPGALPLGVGVGQSTREFPGPWVKSGGRPNLFKGETG